MNASSSQTTWSRPYWQETGENAELLYFVCGAFGGVELPAFPAGVAAKRYTQADLRDWDGYPLGGSLGELFASDKPETLAAAQATPEILRVAGSVDDPADLEYLRITLNALTGLLEAGAVAVIDPQVSGLYDAAAWQRDVIANAGQTLRGHFLVLNDPDPDASGTYWVHTRGMRKFARPDISLVGVPDTAINQAGALCQKLADMQALGGHFAEGKELPVDGVGTLVARHGGDASDPRFFNTHVQMTWPG